MARAGDMDPGHRQTFGALLKHHRRAAGLSQEQLAERAGLTAQAIGALERGFRRAPYRDTVQALARALDLAPGEAAALEASIVRGRVAAPPADDPTSPSLPQPPSPLVGRAREVAEVLALLRRADVRLVTLTGPGGVGKTRLALAVAREVADRCPDGAVFVPLAPLRDPDLVAAAIARALGVRERAGQALPEALRAALRQRDLLLLLDNLEHVAVAAPLVADLLAGCLRLRVLATSRARLRVGGEHVYPVPPLPAPDPARLPPLADLAAVPAVALLVQRATAAAPDFGLDAANAAAVAALCARLDGLPLALELAAARLTVLSPELLLQRLTPRLSLLAGGARDLPERQQTLRATLDWSHALLGPSEQAAFRRLAVFTGGCTLEAAAAVCAAGEELGPSPPASDAVEWVAALLDQSLLRREAGAGGEPRFAMLETVREYAAERLARGPCPAGTRQGEEAAVRRAHAAYYLALAEAAEPELGGPEQLAWLARLEGEHDNLRAALAWALERGEAEMALRLVAALWRFWSARGYLSEGRRWLREALSLPSAGGEAAAAARTRALAGAAMLALGQGAYDEAEGPCAEAVALARARGARRDLAVALNAQGLLARQRSAYDEAARSHEEALALAREVGDRASEAASLTGLAYVAMFSGDAAGAGALLERALVVYRELGDARGAADVLVILAYQAIHAGAYEQADALGGEALALFRALGDSGRVAEVLWALGIAAQSRGDHDRAAALHEEGLALRRARGDEHGTAQSLGALGQVALNVEDLPRARALLEEALAWARRLDERWGQAIMLTFLGHVALATGEAERAQALFAESATLFQAIGNPLNLPWCLEGLAGVAAARGDWERAARLCGARDALCTRLGLSLPPAHPAGYAHALDAVRAALGEGTFAAARAAGEALSPEQALAEALGGVEGAP